MYPNEVDGEAAQTVFDDPAASRSRAAKGSKDASIR